MVRMIRPFTGLTVAATDTGIRCSYAAWSSDRSECIRPRHGAQPRGAGLRKAFEGPGVDGHHAEGGAVAEHPLEVVQQAPVEVAPDVDPAIGAQLYAVEGPC